MLIDFDKIPEVTISSLNGGEDAVSAKMVTDSSYKIMLSRLPAGTTIGMHTHTTSCETNFVISGIGQAVCEGAVEDLSAGCCHCCRRGESHNIKNTGKQDLMLFTVVSEQAAESCK